MIDIRRYTADFAGQETPVIEARGNEAGPRLSVIAGVHGCEYASMAGVRRWVSGLAGRSLRGTVTVVPVVNLPAFWARSPFVVPEDGKNLNRCFPGSPSGTLAERLAHAVFSQVIAGSDALVDMHAGDLVEEAAVVAHVRGLDGVLRYLGMSDDGPAPGPAGARPVYLDGFIWPRTPGAGWWEPAVRAGQAVSAGRRTQPSKRTGWRGATARRSATTGHQAGPAARHAREVSS